MSFDFVKMHGAANDFVVVDRRRGAAVPESEAELAGVVRAVCDRRRGIGADGVLFLDADPECDFAMRYYNADGGEADYCGNGARCLARRALDLGLGRDGQVRFRTAAGIQTARRIGTDAIEVRFGRVAAPERRDGIEAAGRRFDGLWVMAGVPHLVIEVPKVSEVPLGEWGGALRRHPAFAPEGTNVDFIERRSSAGARLGMRTYERGVEGETLACGSGAIASALTRAGSGLAGATIETAGGDELQVRWRENGEGYEVWLEGPARVAFSGTWNEPVATPQANGGRAA